MPSTQPFIKRPIFWLLVGVFFYIGLIIFVPTNFIESSSDNFSINKFYAELLVSERSWSESYHIAPGQPALVAWVSLAFPITVHVVRLMQLVLIVLLSLGTYLLAHTMFERRVAIIAGSAIFVWPPVVLQLFSQSTDLLFSALFIFALLFFIKAEKHGHYKYAVASGLAVALAALTDPVGLYFPFIFIFIFISRIAISAWVKRHENLKKQISLLAIFLATFILVISPWYSRNLSVFGEDAPVIQKGWETVIIKDSTIRSYIISTFKPVHFPTIVKGLGQFFLVPYSIDSLDKDTELSYKSLFRDMIAGREGMDALNEREKLVFLTKVVITLLHWIMLGLFILGLWKLRKNELAYIYVLLVLYLIFATFSYGVPELFKNISPLNGFFFGILPLSMVIATYGLSELLKNKNYKNIF